MSGPTKGSEGRPAMSTDGLLFPLSIVLEYRETFVRTVKSTDKLLDLCEDAIRGKWKERTQLGEWKVTDRYGRELSIYSKIGELGVPPQDTIYMSKKLGDASDENLLVTVEDKIEQKI